MPHQVHGLFQWWLPIRGAEGTTGSLQTPEDKIVVPAAPVKESERLRRLRERLERTDWVSGLPKSAVDALRTALTWQAEIQGQGISRADIARRERITRARVTQIMSLLDLPDAIKAALLGGDHESAGWSVRRALREVG